MFAILRTGGKQYRVTAGDVVSVERLRGAVGEEHIFDEILMVTDGDRVDIGAPLVAGATVHAEIMGDHREAKIIIYKKRQRSTYLRKIGHRQTMTSVRVTDIRNPTDDSASQSEDGQSEEQES